jgi:RNA polymerase sigma factor (sigma-70 family)
MPVARISSVSVEVLSRRALNRATLERQLLLGRSRMSAQEAVEHLVGLQAQLPLNPYTGLWSRLERFRPDALAELLVERQVVRIVVMRATIHLVSADDCLLLRPLMQPVLDRELARHAEYGPALQNVSLDPVLSFARRLFAERPRTGPELRAALAERFPDTEAAALAYACRNLLALVQVPPRGVWGRAAQVTSTTAESWLGRPLAPDPSIEDIFLRYIAAFGPAAAADFAAWSRLTGLREVVERLRPTILRFPLRQLAARPGPRHRQRDAGDQPLHAPHQACRRRAGRRGPAASALPRCRGAYAVWWIRLSLQELRSDFVRPLRLPPKALRQLSQLKSEHGRRYAAEGHEPSLGELAERIGIDRDQAEALMRADASVRSLSEPIEAGEGEIGMLGDLLEDPLSDDAYEDVLDGIAGEQLHALLSRLTDREHDVVTARFGLDGREPERLADVGERLGVSVERVRQLEQRALTKLRQSADLPATPA